MFSALSFQMGLSVDVLPALGVWIEGHDDKIFVISFSIQSFYRGRV